MSSSVVDSSRIQPTTTQIYRMSHLGREIFLKKLKKIIIWTLSQLSLPSILKIY